MKIIRVDSSQLTYTLNENLTHFTTYNIELYVCREWDENEIKDSGGYCSVQKAMTTAKTSKIGKKIIFIYVFFFLFL